MKTENNLFYIDDQEFDDFIEDIKLNMNIEDEEDAFNIDGREDFDQFINTNYFERIFNGDYEFYYRYVDDNGTFFLEKILLYKNINIIEDFDANYFEGGTIKEFKKWILNEIDNSEKFIIENNLIK